VDRTEAIQTVIEIEALFPTLIARTLELLAPSPAHRGNGKSHRTRAKRSRDDDDEALLTAMEGGGTIGAWATAIGKSRTSTVAALRRLQAAGKVENEPWRLVEPEAPPAARWVKPMSAAGARGAHAHA
jgi:hypothetical protein